ncbi:MAG: NAD-dependent succinate-semialdehyde dehydrogenase [Proteobacteria bacterium]|nr:NAD-dependent succinate-semialdehyde dehydrogenase [Pseudomonadota bacterium]
MRTEAYIDGSWVRTADQAMVCNPATGVTVASVSQCDAEATARAVAAAVRAFSDWRSRTAFERAGLLRSLHSLLLSRVDALAALLTLEQGKPLHEAKREVLYGASFVEWYAEEAKRVYGEVLPSSYADKRILVVREPVGVVGAITPWNFPNAMITRKLAPALGAGCCMVLKPAPETPLSALAIAELVDEAGFPPGVFNVVPGEAQTVAEVLLESPQVRKISFTGSTEVGKLLLRESAATVKRVTMELGGNAPFIVFEDADIDRAIREGVASKFRNAGQTCICTNRFLVQRTVLPEFIEKLIAVCSKLRVGNGSEPGVDIGPLINEAAMQKVRELVEDAIRQGATLVLGEIPPPGSRFFPPCVLTGVTKQMSILHQEIFGPVAVVLPFDSETEALEIANSTRHGLASYVFTQQLSRAHRMADALEFGMVGVNDSAISTPQAPFGGVKESGLGREGGRYGIEEYLTIKYISLGL